MARIYLSKPSGKHIFTAQASSGSAYNCQIPFKLIKAKPLGFNKLSLYINKALKSTTHANVLMKLCRLIIGVVSKKLA